jgi:hypothetical protein
MKDRKNNRGEGRGLAGKPSSPSFVRSYGT